MTTHIHRYIARFKVQAETPLFIGSGEASLLKDALVQKDVNGFPMITGTSLAGVLRHAFGEKADSLFGTSNSDKSGAASKLKISSGLMILENNLVSEGILENSNTEILNKFNHLPVRQHVRINGKGVAENNGLFDNEIVYKGTQFLFEMEVRGTAADNENWATLLRLVQSPTFRIGSGTRNGYGSLKVIEIYQEVFDLTNSQQFENYLNFNPSFNSELSFNKVTEFGEYEEGKFTKYSLKLTPDSFFIFSEGFGDDDADNKPVKEEVIKYENEKIQFENQTVIPATSIKGAIAHRVAFHYNKSIKAFADIENALNSAKEGNENHAVATLFGKVGKNDEDKSAGNVFINDFYFSDSQVENKKIFNHVAIDRFTGGAMNGALFSEKVSNLVEGDFSYDIYVKTDKKRDENILKAFEETLMDICKGLLPLGGMTTKGHGIFTGSVYKGKTELFNYNKMI
jgi:CRISPR/Cas system CSM-associated protein Csm3 (group 7 of RAMP superfamily)